MPGILPGALSKFLLYWLCLAESACFSENSYYAVYIWGSLFGALTTIMGRLVQLIILGNLLGFQNKMFTRKIEIDKEALK
jgi:hypothetical protein